MQILIEKLTHPYIREIHFSESEVQAFASYPACPACAAENKEAILAELGQTQWRTRMALAQCSACDHIYYVNPPDEAWFANFYRNTWNAGSGETLDAAVEPETKTKDTAARLLADLGIEDPSTRILEIGCGTGNMMGALQKAGFTDVHGSEASDYRAVKSELRFPGKVYYGGYSAMPDGLKFDVIFSYHVVEHIYNPHDALRWMVERLNPGGVIAVVVPNGRIEPVLTQLLFLPHLHSFSHRSMQKMGESLGCRTGFWKKLDEATHVAAVFTRDEDDRKFGTGFFDETETERLTAQNSQKGRFQNLSGNGEAKGMVHFVLHAGREGARAMAKDSGLSAISSAEARMTRLTAALRHQLANFGYGKSERKKAGKRGAVTAHRTPDGSPLPVVGSVAGDLALHIK